ncbi:MAG: Glucose-repressible alcohol dehydrogenase transcriptional effector [Chrysothrix sp. TS-e1954]|nr:MAG: Glucose-repressible alcohol dehydrogenase transcriptional effector [Chrysothrix sp. TS-e1954]
MYAQSHQQHGHNVFLNGNQGYGRHGMHMNNNKPYQHNNQHHQNHGHRAQQDSLGQSHSSFSTHQHNASGSGFSSGTPTFNPHQMRNGTPNQMHNGLDRPISEPWARQLTLATQIRQATEQHHYARSQNHNKNASPTTQETTSRDPNKIERTRPTNTQSHAQSWDALDFSGLGLRSLATSLFDYIFLTKLYLNNNKLTVVPPTIGRLRSLTELDLSLNSLTYLPEEIGMLVNLKTLLLFDNELSYLPNELGSLHQLDMLGVEGNPLNDLDDSQKSLIVDEGTRSLISKLRETAIPPQPPEDRQLLSIGNNAPGADEFSIMSYNILCDKYVTDTLYGYTPRTALEWHNRREVILGEVEDREADIVCLQEIDLESFHEFFRSKLALKDYKGVFYQKTRAKTMTEKESRLVDGCAVFYKNSKYILLDKTHIEFGHIAINRPDMRGETDIFNRVMPRDDIAIVVLLEDRQTGSRLIVVNAHIFWDPAYKDVKVVQAAILMEQLAKITEQFAKHPPCKDKTIYRFNDADSEGETEKPPIEPGPSLSYPDGTSIPLVVCIDSNSLPESGVYDLLANGSLEPSHPDLISHKYGNFTRDGMTHPFTLKSAYGNVNELPFTNYTPGFVGVIDYIWYTTNTLNVTQLLGEVDEEYLKRVPGFPNVHFPSDHLALLANFSVKGRKERKAVEADFGPQRRETERWG